MVLVDTGELVRDAAAGRYLAVGAGAHGGAVVDRGVLVVLVHGGVVSCWGVLVDWGTMTMEW